MEHAFWHDKWSRKEIGFHLSEAHPWLVRYVEDFPLSSDDVVFVPLCGKTLDIGFFLSQNVKVIANELSETAVAELFDDLDLTPAIESWGEGGKVYRSDNLIVYVGDFFQLSESELVDVTVVYDRAAIVALPLEMRGSYGKKISEVCGQAKQIVMTLEYDQSVMSGPPFSVTRDEINSHYSHAYNIKEVIRKNIIEQEPRFKQKGLSAFYQALYELNPS